MEPGLRMLSGGRTLDPPNRVEGGGTTFAPERRALSVGRTAGGIPAPRSAGFAATGGDKGSLGLVKVPSGRDGRSVAPGRKGTRGASDLPAATGSRSGPSSPREPKPKLGLSVSSGRPSRSSRLSGRPTAGGGRSLVAKKGRRSGNSLGRPRASRSCNRSRSRSAPSSSPEFRQPRSMLGRSMRSRTRSGNNGRSLAAKRGAATISRS